MEKTYNQVLTMCKTELENKKDLKLFCKTVGISYQVSLKIRNGTTTLKYPKVVTKILNHIGYDVSVNTYYQLTKVK